MWIQSLYIVRNTTYTQYHESIPIAISDTDIAIDNDIAIDDNIAIDFTNSTSVYTKLFSQHFGCTDSSTTTAVNL